MKPLLKVTLIQDVSPTHTAKRLLAVLTLAAGLFLLSPRVSYSAPTDCTVDFSNRTSILNIVDRAVSTFVVPSTMANGRFVAWDKKEPLPSSAQTNLNRWQYRQSCDYSRISVWDQYDGHFHLVYRDSTVKLCRQTGAFVFGRIINGNCVAVDPLAEPRLAASMFSTSWFEILLLNNGVPNPAGLPGTLRAFDLKTIAVGGTTPIQMWFRRVDGSVWGWSELGAGVNWDVSGSASGIVAIWISGAPGSDHGFEINNFSIRTR